MYDSTLEKTKEYLHSFINEDKVKDYMRFFKTAQGEYGAGDKFLGVKMPDTRKVVKKFYKTISIGELKPLLYSKYHEERMLALLFLVAQFQDKKSDSEMREIIYKTYIDNLTQVNSWDLVDVTAPHVIGAYLLDKKDSRKILYKLANKESLWDKRVAIISTFAFIRNNDYDDTLRIADILLDDKHDLIHKAVGWMLREVGNRDLEAETNFLQTRYKKMPRTMLRYAIEKFDENLRKKYLKGMV